MLPKKVGRPKGPVVRNSYFVDDKKEGTAIFYLAVPKEEDDVTCNFLGEKRMIIRFQNKSFQYDFEDSFHKGEFRSYDGFFTIILKKQDPYKKWNFDRFKDQTREQQKNLDHNLIFLENQQGKGNGPMQMVNSGLAAAAAGTSTTLNSGLGAAAAAAAAGTSNSQNSKGHELVNDDPIFAVKNPIPMPKPPTPEPATPDPVAPELDENYRSPGETCFTPPPGSLAIGNSIGDDFLADDKI